MQAFAHASQQIIQQLCTGFHVEDRAATETANVMVRNQVGVEAQATLAVQETPQKSHLHKPMQILIESQKTDRAVLLGQPLGKFPHGWMIVLTRNHAQNQAPRPGGAKTVGAERSRDLAVIKKQRLGFPRGSRAHGRSTTPR